MMSWKAPDGGGERRRASEREKQGEVLGSRRLPVRSGESRDTGLRAPLGSTAGWIQPQSLEIPP